MNTDYDKAHKCAKMIVCAIVIFLLLLDTKPAEIGAVLVWIFGINPVAWAIEHLMKLPHKHNLW